MLRVCLKCAVFSILQDLRQLIGQYCEGGKACSFKLPLLFADQQVRSAKPRQARQRSALLVIQCSDTKTRIHHMVRAN